MLGPTGPLELLIVGWYPSADDLIAGRFIADQAAALLATGRVRPSVVSFEPFRLHGDRQLREATETAWTSSVTSAVGNGRAFAPRGAGGPAGVPVLRLGSPLGGTRTAARTHQAVHRATALEAVLAAAPGRWPLIHVHVGFPEGAAVAIAARRAGLPYILTEHATYLDTLLADPDIRAAYLDAARSAARILVVSQSLAAFIAGEFPELIEKLSVVPNTVDVDAFRPVAAVDRDPDELLWVGYRQEAKGTSTLLEAFRAVHDQRPTTRLRMIGRSTTEEEEAGWHRLVAQLGIADAVSIEPPTDRPGIAAAMERAALFVHPSPIETFGVVAVEALAAGLPVVAADSGGVTGVLGPDPGAVGALVPAGDAVGLADAILATLARRQAFDAVALRAHVVDRFGAANVAARLVAVYESVLAEGAVPRAVAPRSRRPAAAAPGSRTVPGGDATVPARSIGALPVVLAAFDRSTFDRAVGTFPAGALGSLVAATAGDPVPDRDTVVVVAPATTRDVAAILALSGRARSGGLGGLVAAPPRWLVRTARRWRLLRRSLPALTAALVTASDLAVQRGAVRPVSVVCLGGIDILAALPLVATGAATIAPGGARWLADQRAG